MNKKIVSDWAKKNFLHWFIEKYLTGADLVKQVLLRIIESEELLSKIHIVLDGSYLRPLLIVSADETNLPPFMLKTFDSNITDPTLIITRLQLLKESSIYLTLYFPDRVSCEPLLAVLEENPELSDTASARQVLIDFELSIWNEIFKRDIERAEIMAQIDEALDERNKRKFRQLVKRLKAL